jgi:hypothetical protein
MKRFLQESDELDTLKMEIKDTVEKSLLALSPDASNENVYELIDGILKDIAMAHPEISMDDIKLAWKDLAMSGSVEGFVVGDEDEEDNDELKELKAHLSKEDFQTLKNKINETKRKIKSSLKENEDELPIEVQNHIQEIINELVAKHPDKPVNSYFGELTAKLMDPADPILTQYNKREVANVVDSYLEKLGLTSDEKPEDAGQITGIKTGEIGKSNPYDNPVTDTVTSQKEISDSIKRHGKMLHEIYKHSASRFLE